MLSLVLLALPALAAALGSDSDYTTRHPKGSMRLPGTSEISSPLTPRALSCNVGSLPCDDGTGCCPVGRFCMIIDGENGCCPIGDTCTSLLGCSVGFYECADSLGGDCCPTGSTCTADHKCRKGNSLLDTLSEPSSTASASSTATEDWTPPAFPTTFSSREDCSDQFDPCMDAVDDCQEKTNYSSQCGDMIDFCGDHFIYCSKWDSDDSSSSSRTFSRTTSSRTTSTTSSSRTTDTSSFSTPVISALSFPSGGSVADDSVPGESTISLSAAGPTDAFGGSGAASGGERKAAVGISGVVAAVIAAIL